MWNWVNALVGGEPSVVADGVSAIARAAMALWEREARDGNKLGFLAMAEQLYDGVRATIFRGLTVGAAYAFIGVGSMAVMAGLASLWLSRRRVGLNSEYRLLSDDLLKEKIEEECACGLKGSLEVRG